MHRITLDAVAWSQLDHFYDALLPELGAPDWHGRNLNALWDSLVGGGINSLQPPFEIVIVNTAGFEEPFRSQIVAFFDLVEEAREAEGIDIRAVAEPPL